MSTNAKDTRTRILEATWKLLERDGTQTRMSDIAKAASVSRQAVYLHFKNRTELLIGLVRHIDDVHDLAGRLKPYHDAPNSIARMEAYIRTWGGWIPLILPVAKALLDAEEKDEAAAAAWATRMEGINRACQHITTEMAKDGTLTDRFSPDKAADVLWGLIHIRKWEALNSRGWTTADLTELMLHEARTILVRA